MLFLALLGTVTAAQLPLDIVGGVRLGDTKEAVQTAWRELGPITESAGQDGTINLQAGVNNATLCKGRVVNTSHEISSRFNDFAQFAELLIEAHGPAASPEVFAVNGQRPASDPRGALKIETAVIRLGWKKAPNYLVQFYEINGEGRAVEALAGPNPCKA